jgi:hypothetical protein
MEHVGIFYGYLVYFVFIWYILWLFGIFFPFWYVVPRKIWQPWYEEGASSATFNGFLALPTLILIFDHPQVGGTRIHPVLPTQ